MCDVETRERLERIEVKIGMLSTDIIWLKRISWLSLSLILAFFGLNAHVIGV